MNGGTKFPRLVLQGKICYNTFNVFQISGIRKGNIFMRGAAVEKGANWKKGYIDA